MTCPTLIRLVLIAALVGMSGASAKASLLTIAATGEPAPGGGTFGANFGVPVINAAGQVAFTVLSNPNFPSATDVGVYQGTSSSDLAAVARIGDVLTSIGRGVAENASGVVAFNANGGAAIVVHGTNGGHVVASAGDTVQLVGGGGPIFTLSSFGDPLINDLGQVAYLATGGITALFEGGVIVAYSGQGDYLNGKTVGFSGPIAIDNAGNAAFFATIDYQASEKFTIATSNTANGIVSASVSSGDDVGGRTLGFDASSLIFGPAGIAFLGSLCSGGTCEGDVFLLRGSSTLDIIAKTGAPAPGGGTFSTSVNGSASMVFDAPHMNDDGSIVFVGWTDGGPGHGVYRYTQAHGLEAMALEGHAPYAAAAGFRNAVINNHDVVAFQAYDGSSGNRRGVYLTDGTTTVRAGSDDFFGAEGSSTGAYSRAFFGSQIEGLSPLNDRAQATFVNSRGLTSQSVMKFTLDPSWAQPGGGAWDTAGNWTFSVDPVANSVVTIAGQAAGPLLVAGPAAPTTIDILTLGGGPQVAELDLQSGGPLTATTRLSVAGNGVLGGKKGAVTTADLEVYSGGRVTGPPTLNAPVYNAGTLDGDFTINGDVTNDVTGSIIGDETFNGNVTNLGTIAPGHSPGTVTVKGDLTLQSMNDQGALTGSVLEIQIGGPNAGTDYDVIDVTGHLTLAGTLHVALIDGFTPNPGQQFHILNAGTTSGTFDAITGAIVTVTAAGIDVAPTTSDTSTTTTIQGGTTTTTTLPASPCADRTGFDGEQCVCAGGLSPSACMGDRVPAVVGRLFTRACTLMQHAAGLVTSKKVKKIVHGAGATFAKDIARVTKAAKARKRPLSPACSAALAGTLGDAKERADQIASTL